MNNDPHAHDPRIETNHRDLEIEAGGADREMNKATVRVLEVLSSFASTRRLRRHRVSQLLGMTKNMTYALTTVEQVIPYATQTARVTNSATGSSSCRAPMRRTRLPDSVQLLSRVDPRPHRRVEPRGPGDGLLRADRGSRPQARYLARPRVISCLCCAGSAASCSPSSTTRASTNISRTIGRCAIRAPAS